MQKRWWKCWISNYVEWAKHARIEQDERRRLVIQLSVHLVHFCRTFIEIPQNEIDFLRLIDLHSCTKSKSKPIELHRYHFWRTAERAKQHDLVGPPSKKIQCLLPNWNWILFHLFRWRSELVLIQSLVAFITCGYCCSFTVHNVLKFCAHANAINTENHIFFYVQNREIYFYLFLLNSKCYFHAKSTWKGETNENKNMVMKKVYKITTIFRNEIREFKMWWWRMCRCDCDDRIWLASSTYRNWNCLHT